MNREIKFRVKFDAYDPSAEWMYGHNMHGTYFEQCTQKGGNYIYKFVDKNTLGQYIGCKDANGKDIYEGDILRADHYPFNDEGKDNYYLLIEWSECAFWRVIVKRKGAEVNGISNGIGEVIDEAEQFKKFTVIGNIHDNPDLIHDIES